MEASADGVVAASKVQNETGLRVMEGGKEGGGEEVCV